MVSLNTVSEEASSSWGMGFTEEFGGRGLERGWLDWLELSFSSLQVSVYYQFQLFSDI